MGDDSFHLFNSLCVIPVIFNVCMPYPDATSLYEKKTLLLTKTNHLPTCPNLNLTSRG